MGSKSKPKAPQYVEPPVAPIAPVRAFNGNAGTVSSDVKRPGTALTTGGVLTAGTGLSTSPFKAKKTALGA